MSLLPTLAAADGLTKAQSQVQSAEAALRAASSKCSLFAVLLADVGWDFLLFTLYFNVDI